MKIREMKKIYAVLYLFIMIFAPPFLLKTNLILSFYSILMILIKYRKRYQQVLMPSGQKRWVASICFFLAYAIAMILINGIFFNDMVQISHYTALFNRFMVLTVTLIPCVTYYICYMESNHLGVEDFIRFMIYASLIEAGLVFFSFVFDDFHNFLLILLRRFGDSDLYENTWYVAIRSYGFAGTFVDTFGFGMGLLAGISLIYGVLYKKIYVFFSLIIAIAGTIDSRTAMVIYAISIVVVLSYGVLKGKGKLLLGSLIGFAVMFIVARLMLQFLENINYATYAWVQNAWREIRLLFESGESTGTFKILFSDGFWQFPGFFQFLFGSGHSLYIAEGYAHSDVGYINDLWFVGIFGMFFLYGNLFQLVRKCYISFSDISIKLYCIFFVLSFLVFNVKGCAIGYNPGMAVMLSMIFVTAFLSQNKKAEINLQIKPREKIHEI